MLRSKATPDHNLPDMIARENHLEAEAKEFNTKVDTFISEKVLKDTSPEARLGRRKALIRAAYGEFMATYIFVFGIIGTITHGSLERWGTPTIVFSSGLVAGLEAVALCYAFSSVSGAHFNPAISFALWVTGKLSNRKLCVYIAVQLLASICAMATVLAIFTNKNGEIYDYLVIKPPDHEHLEKVFATEFFLTYILTYMAFTIAFEDAEGQKKETMSLKGIANTRGLTVYASSPQSKTGFAPFVIGFTIFAMAQVGGESGGCFNMARMFGPALLAGKWDSYYIYFLGQFSGSACAGLMVHNLHVFGLDHIRKEHARTEITAIPGITAGNESLGRPSAAGSPLHDGGDNSDL